MAPPSRKSHTKCRKALIRASGRPRRPQAKTAIETAAISAATYARTIATRARSTRRGSRSSGTVHPPRERECSSPGSTARRASPSDESKRGETLRAAFAAAGVDLAKPMVTTCGSGVTASVLLFGAHLLGKDDVRLYDGSWSEWGADPATPKAKGRA